MIFIIKHDSQIFLINMCTRSVLQAVVIGSILPVDGSSATSLVPTSCVCFVFRVVPKELEGSGPNSFFYVRLNYLTRHPWGGGGVSDLLIESTFRVNHNWAMGGGGCRAQVVFAGVDTLLTPSGSLCPTTAAP